MARTKIPVYKADGTLKDPTVCDLCGTKVARKGDMPRHMRRHLSAEEKISKSYACPYDGCNFTNLQKGNVDTHIRTHTKEKKKCPSCDFETPDPGTLTRHRKRRHEYVPEPRKPRNPGNGSIVDPTQPQIIVETPSTYSRSPTMSTQTPPSPSSSSADSILYPVTSEYDSDTTQPVNSESPSFSQEPTIPDVNVGNESGATQTTTTSSYPPLLDTFGNEYHSELTNVTQSTVLTTYSLPPAVTLAIEIPPKPSYQSLARRGPLGLQDILSEEGRIYWERRL